jgi:hypothetical protein
MMTLSRGCEPLRLNDRDTGRPGVTDNEGLGVWVDYGVLVTRAVDSQALISLAGRPARKGNHMKSEASFRRMAAITAIISAPLALGASAILAWAIDFNPELMSNPVDLIALGARVAGIFRGVEFIGMFGYYLLLIPASLYLWYWLKPHNPKLISLYTVFGLGYLFIGAIGSAVLVSVAPPLIGAYPQASEAQREVLEAVFQAVIDLGIVALFSLSYILGGVWWLGIGLIVRVERRILGIVTVVQGLVTLGYGAGVMLRVEPLAMLEPLTFFAPIWALWLGVVILRRSGKSQQMPESTALAAQ